MMPSLVMPNSDPRDGNFCPYRTTMIDTFSCIPCIYLFHIIKCIQCVGFAITRPRLHVRTAATDAN